MTNERAPAEACPPSAGPEVTEKLRLALYCRSAWEGMIGTLRESGYLFDLVRAQRIAEKGCWLRLSAPGVIRGFTACVEAVERDSRSFARHAA
jgi:hypothetical protein